MSNDILSWHPIGGVLKRRGHADQVAGFYEFAPGTVKPVGKKDPGTRNVGPRMDDSALTVYNGDITLTTGMNISGLDIYGTVNGRGGTVTDCIIRGHDKPTTQTPMAVGQSYNFGGTVFKWCRFDGTGRESDFMDCINGGNYIMQYCEVTRGVDGIGANATGNATIECCRIYDGHYNSWWDDVAGAPRTASYTDAGGQVHNPPFSSQSTGDNHSDGVQIQGQTGWVVRGCNIGGARTSVSGSSQLDPTVPGDYAIIQSKDAELDFVNSCIIVNGSATSPVGALIELNWFYGGAARINLAGVAGDTLSGVTLQNNRFIRSDWVGGSPGYYIYATTGYQSILSNNVYDDDSTAVPIVTH